eukprot:TRINITY_DN329_c0_g1_i1.p2 TRINITY_DN329_c0_g1~~TRINITY_DN329_c0_g1_i1.p2  ORF type:complete len:521 (-),score=61.26 TRINITY_DN329_c0_g1_i1:10211-11773(-)
MAIGLSLCFVYSLNVCTKITFSAVVLIRRYNRLPSGIFWIYTIFQKIHSLHYKQGRSTREQRIMETSYDLICIGAGSGGLGCARRAAKLGKKVALIEQDLIGGTCVNYGCVPKKVLYGASTIFEEMELAKDMGISFTGKAVDWKALKVKVHAYLKKLNDIYVNNCKKDGVAYIEGKAKFLSPHEIQVTNKEGKQTMLTAPHVVISTGSKPLMPGKLPGITHTLSSNDFFQLEELPKTLFIIGGGYIGVELSGLVNSFGTKVSICMLEPTIVMPFDRDITKLQMENMKREGIDIIPEARVLGVEKLGEKSFKVNFDGREPVQAEMVICAMGRIPNYDGLDIDKLSMKLTATRSIETDEYENTSVPGVYAIGDVTGKLMLTPVAIAAGRKLAHRLFGGDKEAKLNYDAIPSVVFSHPPMGKCGITEDEAIAKYGKDKIKVYKSQFNQLFYALTEHKTPTLFKMVCLLPEEKVLGIHALGRSVDEIMQGFSIAVRLGLSKKEFDATVGIHPTASEELVTMTQH